MKQTLCIDYHAARNTDEVCLFEGAGDKNHFQSKIDMDAVKEEVKEIDGHAEMIFDNRQNEHIVNLHSQKLIRKFNNLKKLLGIGGI